MQQEATVSDDWRAGYAAALGDALQAVQAIPDDPDAAVWYETFRDDPDDPDKVTIVLELDEVVETLTRLDLERDT